jgi:predicted GIY-YIG superfamily endonuclease
MPSKHKEAYRATLRAGWHDEVSAHKSRKAHKRKWTEKAILTEAKKFSTRVEWKKSCPNSSNASRLKGKNFHAKATLSMPKGKKSWTKKELIEDAKKYSTKKEWITKNKNAYQAAYKFGWAFLSKATAHMAKLGNSHKRLVYKITVTGTTLIYIGLTSSIERRFKDHIKTKRFIAIANQYGPESIHIESITDYIEAQEAAKLEDKLIEEHTLVSG